MTNERVLIHYGIPGMRWGKRKRGATVERQGDFAKKDLADLDSGAKKFSRGITKSRQEAFDKRDREKLERDVAKAEAKNKEPEHKSMSDKELRDKINRLQMEKQYTQLTAKEKAKGQKFAEDVLVNAAKTTATAYVAYAMKKGVEAAVKSALKK